MASSYQDFGNMSENWRAERQKRRNRAIAAGASVVALLVVAGIAVVAVVQDGKADDVNKSSSVDNVSSIHTTTKSIEAVCASTDFKQSCVTSLTNYTKMSGNGSDIQPMGLVKAAVSVISGGISAALNHSHLIQSDDPKVKGAIEDCKELLESAEEELRSTLHIMDKHGLEKIPEKSPELNNWLSAIISYQQTCIDGFPEGEIKEKLTKVMNSSKELTSNALAIISEATTILSLLDIEGLTFRRRRLLEEEPSPPAATLDEEGLPTWLEEGERRILRRSRFTKKLKKKLKPNVVVAKDGSGDFKTITDALEAMPKKYKGRYVIYVKKGLYKESPKVKKEMVNVTMYGDGSLRTIVTGRKNYVDGTRTYLTATFVAQGYGFMAIAMGFRNTAGAIKHQAVALRVQSDRSVFYKCRMEGYQDTLYAQTHRQFYKSCVIAGTIDFIFGDAAAVIQTSIIVVRRPMDNQKNIVTAQGRIDRHESTGFVIQHCRLVPDKKLIPVKHRIRSYLARPWKEYSRTVIMESDIGDFMHPDGFLPWDGDFALKTLYYAEYNNKGPGAKLEKRVKWPGVKVLKKAEARHYTPAKFIQGRTWIRQTGTPVHMGLYRRRRRPLRRRSSN